LFPYLSFLGSFLRRSHAVQVPEQSLGVGSSMKYMKNNSDSAHRNP
jgi:hypothetical protein